MRSGSLRERGKGKWQYRASYGTHPDKRPRVRSITFAAANKTAAERKARDIRKRWDDDEAATAETEGTVGSLVTAWAKTRRGQSPTTEYRNRSIIAAITRDLGKIKLANLSALDLDLWYLKLAETRSDNTVHHYHRVLRGILRQGMKWRKIDRNAAELASPPERKRTKQLDRMPTMSAIKLMLSRANPTVRMAVLLAASTGARRGELVGLRWSDIDSRGVLTIQRSMYKLPGGTLKEKDTKTEIHPEVPLNPSLLAELHRFRSDRAAWCESVGSRLVDDGPILAHLRKDPTGATAFAPDWLSQEWERLCKRAGVASFKLHGTRHLHVTELHDAGAASALIAERVGHASIATTEGHYTHALPASSIELAATVVEDVFGPLVSPLFSQTG